MSLDSFKSECWPTSDRNGGRLQIGIPGRNGSESAFQHELIDPHGVVVDLSTGEFDMLRALVEAPGKILSRDHLFNLAKNRIGTGFDRVVDVQISRLRRKIEIDPEDPPMIKTIRGTGYMFRPGVVQQPDSPKPNGPGAEL